MIRNDQIDFMVDHNLSIDQFFFLELVVDKDYRNLYKYTSEHKPFDGEAVDDLVRRGFLEHDPRYPDPEDAIKEGHPPCDVYKVSSIFFEHFYLNSGRAAQEVYSSYPRWMVINGRRVSARNIPIEDFTEKYARHCGNPRLSYAFRKERQEFKICDAGDLTTLNINLEHHNRVLMGLDLYRQLLNRELISHVGLTKFIDGRVYESVYDLQHLLQTSNTQDKTLG